MTSYAQSSKKKRRIADVIQRKSQQPLVALTCYDATFARLLDKTSTVDIVLVGDSLGHVIQGRNSTVPVSLEHIVYHTRCVAQTLKHPLLVADLPFGYAGLSRSRTMKAAVELMQSGAEAIKIEGASSEVCREIERLTRNGIPVMGHIGLLPQSVHSQSGYRVQGRDQARALQLRDEALALEAAGCFSIVLEMVDPSVSKQIRSEVKIPTIGIGSGPDCDGQILVLYDLLGLNLSFQPSFVRHFAKLEPIVIQAVDEFAHAIETGTFPS